MAKMGQICTVYVKKNIHCDYAFSTVVKIMGLFLK